MTQRVLCSAAAKERRRWWTKISNATNERAPACNPSRTFTRTQQSTFWSTSDRKSTRLNSSHANISYAVFCLKKQQTKHPLPSGTIQYRLGPYLPLSRLALSRTPTSHNHFHAKSPQSHVSRERIVNYTHPATP